MAVRNRATVLIAVGLTMFFVAGALAFASLRDNDGEKNVTNANSADEPPVVTVQQAAESTPTTAVPQLKIPNGKEAVEVQLSATNGIAPYARVGDRVNVYGVLKAPADRAPKPAPATKLVISNVELLAVNNGTGANTVVVLAVSAAEAEQVIHLASFEAIYLTLLRDGAPPVNPASTPGRNTPSIL